MTLRRFSPNICASHCEHYEMRGKKRVGEKSWEFFFGNIGILLQFVGLGKV